MKNNYIKGVFFILLATFFLALMDGLSRHLAQNYNVFVINMIRAWFFSLVVILLSLRKKEGLKGVLSTSQPTLQLARGILLITAICSGVYSFTKIGLVLTHSLLACYPLLIVALSGPILKEKVSVSNWIAVLVGFVGVLTILNPLEISLSIDFLIPFLTAIAFSLYIILTRKASMKDDAETSFFWACIVGGAVMSIVGPFYYEPILFNDLGILLLLCSSGIAGHFLLIKAYELAEASSLQPFTYFQLFFASIIGLVVFQDSLTFSIILGGVLIVLSGVFVAWQKQGSFKS